MSEDEKEPCLLENKIKSEQKLNDDESQACLVNKQDSDASNSKSDSESEPYVVNQKDDSEHVLNSVDSKNSTDSNDENESSIVVNKVEIRESLMVCNAGNDRAQETESDCSEVPDRSESKDEANHRGSRRKKKVFILT